MKSDALAVNLADTRVDVQIDTRYSVLQEIMADYFGLLKRLEIFLKELSHPYKNWEFIIKEARAFALNYFHLLQPHPRGPEAAGIYMEIFLRAITELDAPGIKSDAVDNLLHFMEHIISESNDRLIDFMPVINQTMDRISEYDHDKFSLFIRSFYQPARLGRLILNTPESLNSDNAPINRLLYRFYKFSFDYWLTQSDPFSWIVREANLLDHTILSPNWFDGISHDHIRELKKELTAILETHDMRSREFTAEILKLPGYKEITNRFQELPRILTQGITDKNIGRRVKLLFLLYIMNVPGLSMIHEETLREINRSLAWLITHEAFRSNLQLLDKTFAILKELGNKYPPTVLNCVLKTGEAVYQTKEVELINYFIDQVFALGFHSPNIVGIGNDWQVIGNPAHVQNIRTWLELIGQSPKKSARLLSALIIFLSVGEVFIKDTDLFPRDLTKFLSKEILPVYNLVKQLARLLPVFFNEIGAEGKLRDISTRLDEACLRKDVMIHFLRKQSHVESSSRVVLFIEQTIRFWETCDKTLIQTFVPPNIYDQIDSHGSYVREMHAIFSHLRKEGIDLPTELLTRDMNQLEELICQVDGAGARDKQRAALAIKFYRLLNQKYKFNHIEFDTYLALLRKEDLPDTKKVTAALKEPDLKLKISMLLNYLDELKELIVSPGTYEIVEDMYQKRHIAVDIPSIYGSYNEARFNALGFSLRIESMVNVLFEELINDIDLSLITQVTFTQILDIILLFEKALKVDGLSSNKMTLQIELLINSIEKREFTYTQYIDIFKGFAKVVKNIIDDHFHLIHGRNLRQIMEKIPLEHIKPKYLPKEDIQDRNKLNYRVMEIFFRDRIVTSLGLQQLDMFLNRILNTLFHQAQTLSGTLLSRLFNYDPASSVTPIGQSKRTIDHIINLGNKGLNLMELKNLGIPVPPGFIVTTEAHRCREILNDYTPARQNFRKRVNAHLKELEKETGKAFGSTRHPLLVSVRSGSTMSQPGMLESYMNVGINREIAESLALETGNPWFAWDSYRRFLQGYGMSFGLNRNDFDAIIHSFKKKQGVPLKRMLTGPQMKQLALAYETMILDSGVKLPESPMDQLYQAINRVFDSWNFQRAKAYRKIMGISDDWGTAATVQTMVYGNISRQSGSGVFFTHSPRLPGDTLRLWGDFTIGNQGEDVVSGLVRTLAISEMQREIEQRPSDISLESGFPELYEALKEIAQELIYYQGWDPQEIEFTFEGPKKENLFLLQTRDMSVRERKIIRSFDFEREENPVIYLGRGIGVSGGPMSGRIVFSLEEINNWRKTEPKTDLILIRQDTVSDDIREIHAADGILTARGGVTSHASIVAHNLKRTCVVGCDNLVCHENKKICNFRTTTLKSGDFLSIDGREGSIYQGRLKIKTM